MNWFYAIDQQQLGPITQEEFSRLLSDGIITPDTMVWREGMANWLPYSDYAASQATPQPIAKPVVTTIPTPRSEETAVCAVSGKIYPKREMVQHEGRWISVEHRDAFFQRLRDGALPSNQLVYCGFWRRFFARVIDMIIAMLVGGIFSAIFALPAFGSRNLVSKPPLHAMDLSGWCALGVYFLYTWFFISQYQGTPGKIMLGMKIVRADGSRLSNGRIIARCCAEWLNWFTFNLTYLMVAIDTTEHRALHDWVCDTRVVRR